jgi:hypothetical protein
MYRIRLISKNVFDDSYGSVYFYETFFFATLFGTLLLAVLRWLCEVFLQFAYMKGTPYVQLVGRQATL